MMMMMMMMMIYKYVQYIQTDQKFYDVKEG
jgi:hypothetical protein